jgi:hypothetical protein
MPALPTVAAVAALVLTAGTALGDVGRCDDPEAICVPLVACVEATGEILRGFAMGRDGGPLFAIANDGVVCEGSWRRTLLGLGVADFTCADGRSGTSTFTWFEKESGTAVGFGQFSDGEVATFWSGNNLERYFREVAPEERQRMACQPGEMLLG